MLIGKKFFGRSFSFKSKTYNIWSFQCLRMPRTVFRRFSKCMSLEIYGCIICIKHLPKLTGSGPIKPLVFQWIKNSFFSTEGLLQSLKKSEAQMNWEHHFLEVTMEYLWKTKKSRNKSWLFFWNVVGRSSMVLMKFCEKKIAAISENFHWRFPCYIKIFIWLRCDSFFCILNSQNTGFRLHKLWKTLS